MSDGLPGADAFAYVRAAVALLLVLGSSFTSAVPVTEAEATAAATVVLDGAYGTGKPAGCWLYGDVRGEPGSYVCQRELLDGRFVTAIVGAKTEMPPVLLHWAGPAPDSSVLARSRAVAESALGASDIGLTGRVYYSPFDLWFVFSSVDSSVAVAVRDLKPVSVSAVQAVEPVEYADAQKTLFAEQWRCYLAGGAPPATDGQSWIEGVPDWDWHYGCAPTAAANILTYWDRRGFDRLVDTVYHGVYDPIEGDIDSVPDVSRKLAVAMQTDTLRTGSTAGERIPMGIAEVCNEPRWGCEYGFVSWLSWDNFDLFSAEIDSGRPGVLCLLGHPQYGSHTVTFCGWGPPSKDWAMVRDCWGGTPREAMLNLRYGCPVGVVPVRPPVPAVAPPDLEFSGLVRPAEEGRSGAVAPEVVLVNRGGNEAVARAFLRVERPGGGIAESFDDSTAFPPAGWSRFNSDGGDAGWSHGICDSGGLTGRAECRPGAEGRRSDDWLVTPEVRVGPADTLHFTIAAVWPGRDSVEVWAAFGEAGAKDFAVCLGAVACTGAQPVACRVGFHEVGDTLVRVGFRYCGEPGMAGVWLDDVRLESVHYVDSVEVTVGPGQEAAAVFRPWAGPPGHYVASCSLQFEAEGETRTDTAMHAFVLKLKADEPREPWPGPAGLAVRVAPSVVRGAACLSGWHGPAQASVFDAVGRAVISQELDGPGRLDCARLAAGVYLLRVQTTDGAGAATRFVVAR